MEKTKTRFLGNCQLCEGDFKLHESKMVHHGYERPGDGYIHGDCPAVGADPYEVSCDLLKKMIPGLKWQLENLNAWLLKLQSGVVLELSETQRKFFPLQIVTIQVYASVTETYRWNRLEEWEISNVRSRIHQVEGTIRRFEQRVADWKPLPIRTIEELELKNRLAKAEREAQLAQIREDKVQDKIVSLQKRIDSAARRNKVTSLLGLYLEGMEKVLLPSGYDKKTESFRMSRSDVLKRVDRDLVWEKLGFLSNGVYELPPPYNRDWNAAQEHPFWKKVQALRNVAYEAERNSSK